MEFQFTAFPIGNSIPFFRDAFSMEISKRFMIALFWIAIATVLAAAGQLTRARGINTSRPVSRVLSGELPLRDGHSSGTPIAERLEQSTRVAGLKTDLAPRFRAHPATPI
jgi:hypothetical protein